MRSQGTKETQGINGDAAALQRQLDAAFASMTTTGKLAVCPFPGHRGADWRLLVGTDGKPTRVGGRVVCGVCHPPARGLRVVT